MAIVEASPDRWTFGPLALAPSVTSLDGYVMAALYNHGLDLDGCGGQVAATRAQLFVARAANIAAAVCRRTTHWVAHGDRHCVRCGAEAPRPIVEDT